MESTGMYACVARFDIEDTNRAIIFENEHGMCEMYEKR